MHTIPLPVLSDGITSPITMRTMKYDSKQMKEICAIGSGTGVWVSKPFVKTAEVDTEFHKKGEQYTIYWCSFTKILDDSPVFLCNTIWSKLPEVTETALAAYCRENDVEVVESGKFVPETDTPIYQLQHAKHHVYL